MLPRRRGELFVQAYLQQQQYSRVRVIFPGGGALGGWCRQSSSEREDVGGMLLLFVQAYLSDELRLDVVVKQELPYQEGSWRYGPYLGAQIVELGP